MSKSSRRDIFVIGFALFSMFFGAGNVIFPPYLGMGSGTEWILGFICYYIADIGLALLALFSMFRKGGSYKIVSPLGKYASTLLMCAIVLCIGPMLAIPRTAAMTFEMGVQPLTSSINSVIFSIVFFIIIFLCTIRENSVIDIVGKILTPLLLAGLLILIVKGVVTPLGEVSTIVQNENVAETGIKVGYQTMDVLATMLFGVLILRSAENKGYVEYKEKNHIVGKASIVAGILLLIVYGGLTYLGATVSSMYTLDTPKAALMNSIVLGLLGQKGSVLFSIVVALACITTAVGLVSSCADFFSKLSKGRISYRTFIIIICVFSAIVSNVGLEQLVSIAAPVLDLVYPLTLVLIIMSFMPKLPLLSYRLASLGAFVVSILTIISTYFEVSISILDKLPLASLGFGWLVPAIILGLIGKFAGKKYAEQ